MSELQAHIRLSEEHAVPYAIMPGDPARVERIKEFLTDVEELADNRGMKSITGYYKGVKVMAISTGMGGASISIVVEELAKIGVEVMIRIGSAGAYKPGIELGDLIIANGAVRDDGATKWYVAPEFPAVPDTEVLFEMIKAAEALGYPHHVGIARSHDSFYFDDEENSEIEAYWGTKGVAGGDFETSTLFVVGGIRGVKTGSILNNVVKFQGDVSDAIGDYVDEGSITMEGEKREIILALETMVALDKKKNK